MSRKLINSLSWVIFLLVTIFSNDFLFYFFFPLFINWWHIAEFTFCVHFFSFHCYKLNFEILFINWTSNIYHKYKNPILSKFNWVRVVSQMCIQSYVDALDTFFASTCTVCIWKWKWRVENRFPTDAFESEMICKKK